MKFLYYTKFISLLILFYLQLANTSFARPLLTKSEILRNSNACFKDFKYELCNDMILKMEKVQLFESEQNRYKCQSSILGLQTEIIEAYFFKKSKKPKNKRGIMIPYVIKNCKLLK